MNPDFHSYPSLQGRQRWASTFFFLRSQCVIEKNRAEHTTCNHNIYSSYHYIVMNHRTQFSLSLDAHHYAPNMMRNVEEKSVFLSSRSIDKSISESCCSDSIFCVPLSAGKCNFRQRERVLSAKELYSLVVVLTIESSWNSRRSFLTGPALLMRVSPYNSSLHPVLKVQSIVSYRCV